MFTIGMAVSTSDNDLLKVAGRERLCECETSVTSVCMSCDNVTKNKKNTMFV